MEMKTKTCSKCKIEFPATTEYFPPDKRSPSGFSSWCKKCKKNLNKELTKKWRENNKEKNKEINKKYYQENKEICKEKTKKYRQENKEKYKELNKKWNEKNLGKHSELNRIWSKNHLEYNRAKTAFRRTKIQRAMTNDTEIQRQIKEIYWNCPEGLTIDHIIPITHNLICGLHVPYNLTYLTRSENSSKSNKFKPYIETLITNSWIKQEVY